MKRGLIVLSLAMLSLLTVSFKANAQPFVIPLNGVEGNCTFNGQLSINTFSNTGTEIEASGWLTGSYVNNMGTADHLDDVMTNVSQLVNVSVSLDGTSCGALMLTSTEQFNLSTTCGTIEFGFSNAVFPFSNPRNNLVRNSLCSIGHHYNSNGKASLNSLYTHLRNFLRANSR